jgi:membrane-associated protein
MSFRVFMTFTIIGAFVWIWSMVSIGYFLGTYIPGIDRHIGIVVVIVVFLSILPGLIGAYKGWRAKRYASSPALENREF